VTTDETRAERKEVPFRTGCFEDFERINVHPVENDCQFVHQGDVEVALCVFDDFCGFCNLDRRSPVDTGFDDRFVNFRDDIECLFILSRDDFFDRLERVLVVTRIDPLR